jgi:hypothetical protein
VNIWLKNTDGKRDAMLTFATVSFAIVTIVYLLSSIDEIKYKDLHIDFNLVPIDAMSLYLASTFSAYVARKWTDVKYKKPEKKIDVDSKDEDNKKNS